MKAEAPFELGQKVWQPEHDYPVEPRPCICGGSTMSFGGLDYVHLDCSGTGRSYAGKNWSPKEGEITALEVFQDRLGQRVVLHLLYEGRGSSDRVGSGSVYATWEGCLAACDALNEGAQGTCQECYKKLADGELPGSCFNGTRPHRKKKA